MPLWAMLMSCSQHDASTLHNMTWILGNWEQPRPDGVLRETWTRQDDTLFTGQSSFVNLRGEQLFSERVRLVARPDGIWYITTVAGQNNNQPVPFRAIFQCDREVTFENKHHDFPQKIMYHRVNDSLLAAMVQGVDAGRSRQEVIRYRSSR